ncbi:DNA mismatch repair protein MutS [Pelolinea submarina]|uniref:DNA mismatch repair protein MutS n=1 Tax=Pelolinea submarina TaxID=913107 RepID=A0A347ZSX2_9CHLR|nr:DNA mismatch repair protein MutS [Pelolinea submarina]REG11022.1 DNA mismatch repair protein MutS [Pelolinea submarina]BBB48403.1 DNA mismatch repair protein MutS [Pelolinea submarina]
MSETNATPIRQQYLDIKKNYPDAIVFFRLGDFYETFDEDAEITSRELDIVLTGRNVAKGQKVPMAGIPYHAADNYISRLIEKGYHVAICEQIGEQPQKGIFPREVIRLVSPGTVIEPGLIKNEKNNYLVSLFIHENTAGLAFLDISTGEIGVSHFNDNEFHNRLNAEISRLHPSEILLPESIHLPFAEQYHVTSLQDWKFELGRSEQLLKTQFHVSSLDGFGLKNKPAAVAALGAILGYVKESDPQALALFTDLNFYAIEDHMVLDEATRRNLELTETILKVSEAGSLLGVMDKTRTPMGKRMIRRWVNQPLIHAGEITERLDAVEYLLENGLDRLELQKQLRSVADIERIINRVVAQHAVPRDLVALRETLEILPVILKKVSGHIPLLDRETGAMDDCSSEFMLLRESIAEDPPATLAHTGVIRPGYSSELDEIIQSTKNSRDYIANLEKVEKERTGIKTLKVGFNKVFGYYIEISNSYADQAPEEYIRKQTLVNAERFITPKLKEYETIVLNAEENIHAIENRVFKEICAELKKSSKKLLAASRFLGTLDVLASFAQAASENNYVRPKLSEDKHLMIKNGRHPVVEKTRVDISFVPNDTVFANGDNIQVITGPNMSGKSTYLRQVALIVLLAQIGSFVPADAAEIGIVDRIFTRIGAQDEIHAGQSTFMVEMIETANILHNATDKSLLILDEIGRGTSTYDGLSIAWAVLEYIHNHPRLKSRTLFATHYHELTQLPDVLPNIKNYNVAVSEVDNQVIFLHKIVPGGADRSYGIHVAQLAGIPGPVITRANEILAQLEGQSRQLELKDEASHPTQMALFTQDSPVLKDIKKLDPNSLSPIEALNKIYQWKKDLDKG